MNLPAEFVPHLDHRITVLLSFTIRRDVGFFGAGHGEQKALGDVYRTSLEGSGIMLRVLLEFLGVKPLYEKKTMKLLGLTPTSSDDTRLGAGALIGIPAVDISQLSACDKSRLATIHDEVSKRSGHPAFEKLSAGLDPNELAWATEWVVREIWQRCYSPDPLVAHRDIVSLMPDARWRQIPFCFS